MISQADRDAAEAQFTKAKALGYEQFQEYLHADRAEFESDPSAHAADDGRAATTLEQLRRAMIVGQGQSRCRRLSPGRTFTLEGHAVDGHDGRRAYALGDTRRAVGTQCTSTYQWWNRRSA